MPPPEPGATPRPIVLEAKDVAVRYRGRGGDVCPIEGFALTIREGEVVGLIGDAGAGKSTAALALMGIARPPGVIERGTILFDGKDLRTLDEQSLRQIRGKEIGIIVQNPRASLNPMLRVGRQIRNVYQAHNAASAGQARDRAVEMLRMVGINDPERRVDAYAHELSGGMAQRALIAIALSSNPRLLIADEPTSGLDVTIQAQFLDQMWATVQSTGSAILLITQDLGIVANYCDRVVVLFEGRIVEDRPVRDFFADPQHGYSRSILDLQSEAENAQPGHFAARSGAGAQDAPLISVRDLHKTFAIRGSDKVVQAVEGVSFDIGTGETLGLVGESGSGKTTVGRCLLRLVEPTSGEIAYRGQDIGHRKGAALKDIRSRLQIVFQDPYDSVNPRWTIERILREPLDLHSDLSANGKRERIRELLSLVGLDPNLSTVKPKSLGAGALQRLNIARALATEPEFIILDEPTSVLPPVAVAGFVKLLRRLQSELGLSFLFISHDLTTVKYICDRVGVMYLGQIVELGTVEQVFANAMHPYARSLLASHLFPDPTRRRVEGRVSEVLVGEIPSPVDLPSGCYLAGRCPHAVGDCHTRPQRLEMLPDGRLVRCHRVTSGELDAEAAQ